MRAVLTRQSLKARVFVLEAYRVPHSSDLVFSGYRLLSNVHKNVFVELFIKERVTVISCPENCLNVNVKSLSVVESLSFMACAISSRMENHKCCNQREWKGETFNLNNLARIS